MPFVPDFRPPAGAEVDALWFLFQKQKLLIKVEGEQCTIPGTSEVKALEPGPVAQQYIGALDDRPCYVAELPEGASFSSAFSLFGLRALFGRLEDPVMGVAGLANQLMLWNRNHQYCGSCGNRTEDKADERAKVCARCDVVYYPRLSPAVIVAVRRDREILLARSRRMPSTLYSVLAGFVEPGETLEACVEREIREEVGIAVKNIRYFGSQPWPFPDSLMIAFTAEYAGGDIQIDPAEITDAGWFRADSLPRIPPKISIARQLIDWFSMETRGEGS